MNGARVSAIVNELRGEKIDIINWDENPALLIENALSPAKVIAVMADPDEKTALVVVPDYQLSLAIGKERTECTSCSTSDWHSRLISRVKPRQESPATSMIMTRMTMSTMRMTSTKSLRSPLQKKFLRIAKKQLPVKSLKRLRMR